MNYLNFYKKTEQQLIDAMTTLWVPGHPKEIEYLKHLFEKREPIMSEPEFQTIFPWETSSESFAEHSSKLKLFDDSFVKSLSEIDDEDYKEYSFPVDRHPYKHQTKSWMSMLRDKKTIVVTTGTGSGKTECFMLPVLQDLYQQRKNGIAEGVQAIFLYPLNALMKNQQKRIHAWCKSLNPYVTYAIYNGDTEESRLNTTAAKRALPQICSRDEIRETPPQILFTNPTMLNYMLVRAEDQQIMQVVKKSRGKLRWILLDEAHTYTGSSAAELALQIRQVIDAFGVSIDDVNFALTSATIGDGSNSDAIRQLKENVSKLTGKSVDNIVVIDGKRIIPELNESKVNETLQKINTDFGTSMLYSDLTKLRKNLNERPCMSSKDIVRSIPSSGDWDIYKRLDFINALGEKVDGLGKEGITEALLPTRAHFFIRSIGGIYTCLNPNCPTTKDGSTEVGSLTSYQSMECPHCGMPLLEVGVCSDCGGLVVTGEYDTKSGLRMRVSAQELDNLIFYAPDDDSDGDDTGNEEHVRVHHQFFVMGHNDTPSPRSVVDGNNVVIDTEERKIRRANTNDSADVIFKEIVDHEKGTELCPHCANTIGGKVLYFRTSTTFLSRVISPILLDNADPMEKKTYDTLFDGKKYIAFTDSRQGTAKGAMQQNLEVERRWIRSALFHELAERRRSSIVLGELTAEDEESYVWLKEKAETGPLPPVMKAQLEELENRRSGNVIVPSPECYNWNTIEQVLINDNDLKKLAHHMRDARKRFVSSETVAVTTLRDYLQALFIDQFGWIPKRGNTLESLGFVHLVYPKLNSARVPADLARKGFTDSDWKSFLKICLDYFVRAGRCLSISDSIKPYLQQSGFTRDVYSSDSNLDKVLKWPTLNVQGTNVVEKQQRIVLILCAALNMNDFNAFTRDDQDLVNGALNQAWLFLKDNVLTETDHENHGYRLDMINSNNVAIQLMSEGWRCPVNNVIVDTILKGHSPRIMGCINADNYKRYKIIDEKIDLPYYPYAFRKEQNPDGSKCEVSESQVKQWTLDNWKSLYNLGLYRDIHMGVLLNLPIFMAGEHSAQQQKDVLEKYEKDFNEGRLNILSCSTTMEMGVDLKGISEVVMNTVPPKSANYLQRAGRAGRRGESKAMAVTFCSPTPVAMNAWNNPSWPMTENSQLPQIKLESLQIIQRHVNSLLFAKHISSVGGMKITTGVGDFFDSTKMNVENFRQYLDHLAYDDSSDVNIVSAYKALVKNSVMSSTPFSTAVSRTIMTLAEVQKVYKDRLDVLEDSLTRTAPKKGPYIVLTKKIDHFKKQNILTFFAENGFLPSSGIPTGLVEFMPMNDPFDRNGEYKKQPTQHISQAIANYAPGKQVVINEWCYESSGIALKTKYEETKRNILQSCSHCGYTTINYGDPLHDCPVCHSSNSMQGVKDMNVGTNSYFTEIVEPAAFGVRYGYEPKRTMKSKSSMEFIQPVLLNMDPWTDRSSDALFAMRCSTSKSEILVYNKGKGMGYAYCPYCGAMEAETHYQGTVGDKNPLELHKHFETGGPCDGSGNQGAHIRRNVLLVGHYQTDFVEMKFYDRNKKEIVDESTLYSLGVIISRKLTEVLGVNDGEIDFGYCANYNSIFIYDTAIGGAGYTPLLRDYKSIVLDECRKALADCKCSSACTHCLIDRRSQWYINYLNREKALDWLDFEYETRKANDEVRSVFSDANVVTSDFQSEFYAVTRDENLTELTIFVDSNVSRWQPGTFSIRRRLEDLKAKGISVKYVVDKDIDCNSLSAEQQTMLMTVAFKESFSVGHSEMNGMIPLMIAEFSGSSKTMYFGKDIKNSFDNTWGNGQIFETKQVPLLSMSDINASQLLSQMNSSNGNMAFESYVTAHKIHVETLFDELYNTNREYWDKIKNALSDKKVTIEYDDRYLLTPTDVLILARFIQRLKYSFSLEIESIKVNFDNTLSRYDGPDYNDISLGERFPDQPARRDFATFCFEEYLGISPIIRSSYEEHSRPMIIASDDCQLVIRPDAGVAHNWRIDRNENPDVLIGNLVDDPDMDITIFSKNWDTRQRLLKNKGELYFVLFKKK